ncbi:MAG TPA: hypothetical protein VJ694_02560 [Patescibacteria group bacterium]|nr:hypothetical protein [Patescibacteria group bacterium]
MSEPSIPEARTVLTFRQRLFRVLPGIFLAALLSGVFGAGIYGCYGCTKAEEERKARECKALSTRLDRVERVVRETGTLRAYVREPGTQRLLEYRFPADSGPYGTVTFIADAPEAGPLRIVSTSVLEPNEQCVQTVEVHVRSARDIE